MTAPRLEQLALNAVATTHDPAALAGSKSRRGEIIDVEALWPSFINPPDSARPRVWWHWMDGNVDADGITADLEWLQTVGVRGVQMFEGGMGTPLVIPAAVEADTPEWQRLVAHAVSEADRLGLELTIASSPGWSSAGGPWVAVADAMQKLVWSETSMSGGSGHVLLPPLPDVAGPYQGIPSADANGVPRYAHDLLVVAFPDDANQHPLVPRRVTGSAEIHDPGVLWDGRFHDAIEMPRDPNAPSTAWIERVGNAASEQLQLDVYGDVIDALYQTRRQGAPGDDNVWSLTRKLLEWLEEGWKLPDHGIWEVRGPARHFTHSKVMAWVAFDRAVRATEEWGREGPVERWRAIRDEIHAQVIERSWSDHHQAFAQSYGSDELDASVLLMAPVGFMPAADPRFVSTVSAVERELVSGGLVMRYRARADGAIDGITSDEAAFLPCSFWLADALALIGEFDRARELFERLLDLRNELGLLSEEYDPVANRQLGNYPQAFTHLALINTAFVLREGRPLRGRG